MEVDAAQLDELDAMYASDEDKKKKKKKAKQKKESTPVSEDTGSKGDAVSQDAQQPQATTTPAEVPEAPKTAAQKKKQQKKEREKAKKAQNQDAKPAVKPEVTASVATTDSVEVTSSKTAEVAAKAEPDEEDSEKKGDDKKKKGKKKKGTAAAGEEKKVESARSKHVAKIRETLQKKKEEEERLRKEEEERIRREEEAEQLRQEELRKEQERKERKKQKEKEKKLRMKQEGKLLTEKQKQDRRRVQEMVAQRGLDISEVDGEKKKRPRYERLRKKKTQEEKPEEKEGSEERTQEATPLTSPTEEKPEAGEGARVVEEDDDDDDDDWEKLADDDEAFDNSESLSVSSKQIEDDFVKVEGTENGENATEEQEEAEEEDEEDEDEEGESSSSESEEEDESVDPIERARERIHARHVACNAKKSTDNLRAPVVCVLGHVDTGKTKILDKLRRTHVQDGEAGGITQQIGATNVPADAIMESTKMVKEFQKAPLNIPGMLIIDTPGHESFSNLRSRGSSLCDLAILVVDIMHGLEPQTIESIQLLKKRKTPFIVALNKVDRLFQWRTNPNSDIVNTLKKQQTNTQQEFQERVQKVVAEFAIQELNVCLFNENKDLSEYISMVPTSAITGDGMGNLLAYLCEYSQKQLKERLAFSEELQATVMEVKEITGLGTTIDVILVNGYLHEGQHIVIAGQDRPIVTQIRGLLMPQPMKELRVKNPYSKFKTVQGAQGVKIIAKDLEKALAGLPLFSSEDQYEQEVYCEEVSRGLKSILKGIQVSEKGVYVQASTLGSLEALLEFLRTSKIPYASINIGPVHKRDVMKASAMLDRDPQWAVILAFDVKVEREAQEMADSLGVTIFTADIIYHLFDRFIQHREDLKKANQEKFKHLAVFPAKLRILPQYIFNSRDPIVCGVIVEGGILREGTPLCVPSKNISIGRVTSVEFNHKAVQDARRGQEVCIKIENPPGETPKLYGRHFDHTDLLVSKISRESIDAVKDHFRDDLTKEDWKVMVELKKMLGVA